MESQCPPSVFYWIDVPPLLGAAGLVAGSMELELDYLISGQRVKLHESSTHGTMSTIPPFHDS